MTREETSQLKPGDKVIPVLGPYTGRVVSVLRVEMNYGAYTGWVTVELPGSNGEGLFAGGELRKVPE